jgi:hypothetical protein
MFMNKPKETPQAPLPPRLTEAQAQAMLRAKEAELAARALEEAAAFEREKREAERAAWRAEQAAKEKAARAVQARVKWSKRLAQGIAMFPITVTTTMAMIGQFGWGLVHLNQIGSTREDLVRILVVALFSAGLESLSLFQGYHADRALQRRDSAFGLYAGAFGTSAIVGALNYSHYASTVEADRVSLLGLASIPGPTATAVVFALFSFISPALWRIHSRAKNRDRLKAAGEIDTRAVRLSWSRKFWHPIRSIRTMYWATWASDVETPADAIALYEAKMAERRARKAAKASARPETVPAKEPEKGPEPELESGQEGLRAPAPIVAQRFPEAWAAFVASAKGGNPLTQRALARDYLNNNRHHARDIIAAWEEVHGHDDDVRSPAA